MRFLIAFLTLASCLPASAVAATTISVPVYVVGSRGGGLGVIDNEVTVISRIQLGERGQTEVWIAERRRNNQKRREWIVDHQWVDGRTCPALLGALQELKQLPTMQFGSPETMADTGLAFDVPMTILQGPPSTKDGVGVQLSRREYLGPVAEWRLKMERRIAGCWQDDPVVVPGANVVERLGTDDQAEVFLR